MGLQTPFRMWACSKTGSPVVYVIGLLYLFPFSSLLACDARRFSLAVFLVSSTLVCTGIACRSIAQMIVNP